MRRRSAPWGALAILTGSVLFAVNGTVAKIAMQSGLSPERLVELRCLGSAVLLVAVALIVNPRALRASGKELAVLALLGVVGVALVQWCYLVAISRLPVGLALLLEYTAPLLVALWARFVLREQVRARVWWALAACLAGLALVAQVGDGITLDGLGIAAGLGAAVALAAYYLLGERLMTRREPLTTHAWSMTFAALLWVVLQPLWTFPRGVLTQDAPLAGPLADVRAPMWLLVLGIVVLGTAVPYLLFLVGIRRLGAARAGLLGMSEPVAASAVAWVVLGEAMTAVQLIGAAVVLAGIGLAETSRRRSGDPVDVAQVNPAATTAP
ncbi:EamA family transporter [Cellulomonas cellasea]|uniref:EamA family transporter n=1 Tax=Cellulomonas cellasea TaxID=43670 RepID=UPI0025A3459A|nr:EamA family transporter [Cellulomonas cellasea]MDM8086462.1 EamA family transporter [Cellulomonas cellasea]